MDERDALCRSLGLPSPPKIHEMVLQGLKPGGVDKLVQRGLVARRLTALGYTLEGMRRLGYPAAALRLLGYDVPAEPGAGPEPDGALDPDEAPAGIDAGDDSELRRLFRNGARANDFKQRDIPLHQLKIAGLSPRELSQIGYSLNELLQEFTPFEMKRIGFGPRELSKFQTGAQLKGIGFTANEMRVAGYGVRELLRFGYNENQIVAAGYTTHELIREGLSRFTKDTTKLGK